MNDELIFVKTLAGEDAVRDRTRLVQRNLRMVLILVDGLTNVSALKQKAGDPAMIETALAELERIGLIESTETRGSRKANSIAEALSIAPKEIAPEETEIELPSDVETVIPDIDFPTVDTVFEELEVPPVPSGIWADTPNPTLLPQSKFLESHAAPRSGLFSRLRQRWQQMREERTYERAYGQPTKADADFPSPPIRLPRRKLKLKPVLLTILVGILAFGALRVILYPYDEYRPTVETQLSRILSDEVKVERITFSPFPFPAFKLHQVTIGSAADATVDEVALVPDWLALIGGKLFRIATVSNLRLREGAFGKLDKWFLRENMGDVELDRIEIRNLSVDLGWVELSGLSGGLTPGAAGVATFSGEAGKGGLHVEVVPGDTGIRISAHAGEWLVPVVPPFKVSALDISGTLFPGRLVLDKLDARMLEGSIVGAGTVVWKSAPKTTLDLTLKHVAAASLLTAMEAPTVVAGYLSGQVRYTTDAPSSSWLNGNASAEGSFIVDHGTLNRIDLVGALKPGVQGGGLYRGGETGFEELSGKFSWDAKTVRVSGVRLSSGLMAASGQATVTRETGIVSGSTAVEMRGASAPQAWLSIGGKASDPELKRGGR
ncbi:MAG: hypothetical protein KJ634_01700 [Gammaproteobacteria bacterium]|nr:hypothetical protein [Gammaproteobacteria bacterium]MBU1414312.1 hypothetical protein [Gammaproteobacteria bacterium]